MNTTLFQYGSACNVMLSDAELGKLRAKFGKMRAERFIETFSLQKAAHGYTYKSDFRAILAWARKDGEQERSCSEEALTIEERAKLLQASQQRAFVEWQLEKRTHKHRLQCGEPYHACPYRAEAEPQVSELWEIVGRLRDQSE